MTQDMSRPHLYRLWFALVVSFICSAGYATWKPIFQMEEPVSCVFFLDPNHGFAGTGSQAYEYTLEIWYTTNGGTAWTKANVPGGDGRVTQIAIRPDGTGYASISSKNNPRENFWMTTDGGYNWKDISSNNFWYGTGAGFNGEFAYWYDSTGANNSVVLTGTNGVFTMPGKNTVITPGPNRGGYGEAWGGFGDASRNIWYFITETSRSIYYSLDGGTTWLKRYTFPLSGGYLCGSIVGVGTTLYVQSEQNGIFRGSMSDTGRVWTPVNGPSNDYDTRTLFVTGCAGEKILAFDNKGMLFVSDDGGDQSRSGADSLTIVHATFNSISSCSTATKKASFAMKGCIPYVLNNYQLVNNPSNIYTLQGAVKVRHPGAPIPISVPDTLIDGDSLYFTVNFTPHLLLGAYNSQIRLTGFFEAVFGSTQQEADSNIQITGSSKPEPPKYIANVSEIDFGGVSICGGEVDSIVTIHNIGCDTMQITSGPGTLDSMFIVDNISLPFTIPPDSTITIHVHFKPTHAGTFSTISPYPEYQISAQGQTSLIQFILTGTGIPGVGTLSLGRQNFTFDTLSICSKPDSISGFLTNIGCGPLVVDTYSENGDADFSLTGITPGAQILPGDTLRYTIVIQPQAKGERTKSFVAVIKDKNNVGTPRTVTITSDVFVSSGTKLLSTAISRIDFGATTLCQNPSDSAIVFTNPGCDTVEIIAAQMSGSGFQVSGANFPIVIPGGSSAKIIIHPFLDTTGGKTVMNGTVTITNNSDKGSPIIITFTRSILPHRTVGIYLDAAANRGTDQDVVTFNLKEMPGKPFAGAGVTQVSFDLTHNSDLLEYIPSKSSANLSGSANGQNFILSNPSPDANGILAIAAFRVYLTKDSTSTLSLANVVLGGVDTTNGACATTLSYSGTATFGYDFSCGERNIQNWMNGIIPSIIIGIHPNPAHESITIDLYSRSARTIPLEIINSLGERVYVADKDLSSGVSSIQLDTRTLSGGIYLVRAGSAAQSFIRLP